MWDVFKNTNRMWTREVNNTSQYSPLTFESIASYVKTRFINDKVTVIDSERKSSWYNTYTITYNTTKLH
jgi:hypothetical protein